MKIFIATVCVILCAFIVWCWDSPPRVFTRTYQGKNLDYWVGCWAGEQRAPTTSLKREQYRTAIRTLRSNDVPALVAALDYDLQPYFVRMRSIRDALHGWLGSLPPRFEAWLLKDRRSNRVITALTALSALRPRETVSAIPRLQELASGSNISVAETALLALSMLGTNGQKRLLSIMADENHPYRYQALEEVSYDEDFFQPGANPDAFPVLALCTQSKDKKAALLAVRMVGELGITSDICFPALVAALTNSDPQIRW